MKKFMEMLTNSSEAIKSKRGGIITTATENKQLQLINTITDEINECELQLERLTDISPENTYSLRPGGDNFDPNEWVLGVHNLKIDIYEKKITLEIAMKTYEEWFGEKDNDE